MLFSREDLLRELAWRKKWDFPEEYDIGDAFDVAEWMVEQLDSLARDLPVEVVVFLQGKVMKS